MTALIGKQINTSINILSLSFEQALPYWIQAFDIVLQNLDSDLNDFNDKDLFISNVRMLCYPDPRNRGHHKNVNGNGNSFNMERFVESFNLMARKAEINLK